MTTLRLYNTLTKQKDDFAPLDAKNVRIYVCGPTVYDYAHIGNARPAIVFDVLFRLLRHVYGEPHVTYVRNITDIDDKINARAAERAATDKRNVPILQVLREITEATYGVYKEDVSALGCLPPTEMPRATEYVKPMIAMIETLIAQGYAYAAEGHVLFRVKKKADYGKLARRSLDDMIAGARIDVAPYKEDPMDFVLWKPSVTEQPGWDSPWGYGRPGWHLECSAMIESTMGETIDIHGGGIDLVFPHHENEIAQSESAHHGHPLARYWMHNGFLNVEGEKMSKSLGNFVTINELLQDFSGAALRFAMLQTHYRLPINWMRSKAEEASEELRDWATTIYSSGAYEDMSLRRVRKQSPIPHPSVVEALSDDLNTSDAITALRELYKKRGDGKSYSSLIETAEFLGLFDVHTIAANGRGVGGKNLGPDRIYQIYPLAEELRIALLNRQTVRQDELKSKIAEMGVGIDVAYDGDVTFHPLEDSDAGEIEKLIEARKAARAAKDFKESDRIRDELLAKGIVLKDGPTGTTWEVKR